MLWDRNVDLEWWVGDDLFFKPLEDMFDLDPDIEAILRNHFPDHHLSIEGPWVFVHRGFIPEQGWKIHISAVDTNALRVLDKVCNVLKRYPVSFKVLKHKALHLATNSKGFPRGSSGKWITIYPIPDLTSKVLESLYDVLYDEVGPYILSDIRYKNAKNVYIRYGGFVMKHMINLIGEKIPHILSPSGSKYVDKRLPYFTMPPWVTWDFNFPNTLSQEDTGEISLKNGRYFVREAFQISNTGGVYLGFDIKSGQEVVIKEARPYTGFFERNDAIRNLYREWNILKAAYSKGLNVPEPLDFFFEWEHAYMIMEFINKTNIREHMLSKPTPALLPLPLLTRDRVLDYYRFWKTLFLNITKQLTQFHQMDIMIVDFSPLNILSSPDGRSITWIDFEASIYHGSGFPMIFTPGHGFITDIQQYDQTEEIKRLVTLMAYMIFPLPVFYNIRKDLYKEAYPRIVRSIHWPEEIHILINEGIEGKLNEHQILDLLQSFKIDRRYFAIVTKNQNQDSMELDKDAPAITETIKDLGSFIKTSFSVDQNGFFPLTPFSYRTNPYSLGFGTSGILWALKASGVEFPEEWYDILESEILRLDHDNTPPGLLTGFSGMSLAFLDFGNIEMAEHLIQKSLNHPLLQQIINHSLPDMDQVSIHWGLAGILFTLLLIYNKTGNEKWLDHACQLGNILTQHIPEKTSYVDKANPGFGYGASGVAFSLLLLARISGQQSLSKFAKHWLDLDISCIQVIQPELGVYGFRDELNVGESYFEIGTAGFVSVVLRFWKYFDEDREMMRLIEWVELDLFRKYSVLGGYLWGLSGVLETLYDLYHYTQKDKYHKISKSILQGLFDVHIFTPEMKLSSEKPHIQGKCTGGLGLWRVSTDLATGSAGVLYVLSRISKKGHSLFFRDSLLYP